MPQTVFNSGDELSFFPTAIPVPLDQRSMYRDSSMRFCFRYGSSFILDCEIRYTLKAFMASRATSSTYSKTCLKWTLKMKTKIDFQD